MHFPSHAEIETSLAENLIGMNASELHGSLCGYLAAGGAAKTNAWCEALALEALQDAMQDDPKTQQLMQNFFQDTYHRLLDSDLSFAPLLPDVEQKPGMRAGALVEWCRGFIGGLGLADNEVTHTLSEEARELLVDLSRIAGSDPISDEDDSDEANLMEIFEYVRVAVLFLHSELTAVAPGTTRH